MSGGAWKAVDSDGSSALAGLRVLDVSGVGAFASMLFADFGADVIRVAPPRAVGKKFTTGSRLDPHGELDVRRASAFNALHRGQRSVGLNLKSPEGREVFEELSRDADVVLESFRPGVMARLGLDYEKLNAANERLVYCSLSGYGQTGPYSGLPGHDINYIALGGLLGLTRRKGTPPVIPLNFGADFAGGALFAAAAILIALQERGRSGRGQYIDMSMTDGVLSLLTSAFIGYFADGEEIRPSEYALNGGAPWYDVYECSDGKWIALGCIEPYFFEDLCKALELEEFVSHEFDAEWFDRIRIAFVEKFRSRPQASWMQQFEPLGIAASPVLELPEIPGHDHVAARAMVSTTPSEFGVVRQIGVAPKLGRTPGFPRGSPPEPGRDSKEILLSLGHEPTRIARLIASGAIFEPEQLSV